MRSDSEATASAADVAITRCAGSRSWERWRSSGDRWVVPMRPRRSKRREPMDPASAGQASHAGEAAKASQGGPPEHAQPASLGEGFVVWESNRRGKWRIWSKSLDGTGLRQLTPEEPGRQHFAPHISPDGRWLSYLSSTNDKREYDSLGTAGSLHALSLVDGEVRLLAESARSYFENRAVVWLDSRRLIYIDGSGATLELDIVSGERKQWLEGREGERGWLLSATLQHATTGGRHVFALRSRAPRCGRPLGDRGLSALLLPRRPVGLLDSRRRRSAEANRPHDPKGFHDPGEKRPQDGRRLGATPTSPCSPRMAGSSLTPPPVTSTITSRKTTRSSWWRPTRRAWSRSVRP